MAKTRSMSRNQNNDDASSKKKIKTCIFCVGMAKTRSMTRNQKHDDASSKKRIKTCDNGRWSDLNHDLLLLVMVQLGVIDYVAFSRVCKSWGSLALRNKNKFIQSRPPMSISISSTDAHEKKCHLVDFEGRKLKIAVPHSADRTCIGVTCGYLILCGQKTRDFWLVNPITRHELHFPSPFHDREFYFPFLGAILVFSPSISGWVFVVFWRLNDSIYFCIAGKQEWTRVFIWLPLYHLQAFKGKIYTLYHHNRLGEVRLFPTPKVTLLKIKNYPNPCCHYPRFVSSRDNLYAMDLHLEYPYKKIQEMDFSKMEWVSLEKAGEEYGFFYGCFDYGAAVIRAELWADHKPKYRRYVRRDETGKDGRLLYAKMWYFFHDSLNVNLLPLVE